MTPEHRPIPGTGDDDRDSLEAWTARLALTCPGCGCKSIVDGLCSKCGARKRAPSEGGARG
jgi:hypothetical protein